MIDSIMSVLAAAITVAYVVAAIIDAAGGLQ